MSKKKSLSPKIFSKIKFLSLLLLLALLLPSCNKSKGSGDNNDSSNSEISNSGGDNSSNNSNSNKSGGSSSVKSFNNVDDLKSYLDKQPANSPDDPIKVTISADASTLPKIADAINSSGKYVSLTISGSALTTVPRGVFNNCRTLLVSVTLPNSVTSIGNWAFMNCTNLKSITIPNSVTGIGANAFNNCTSLASITIPNSVTNIGSDAFSNCTGLKSIAVPKSVTEIGEGAFSKCTNLTSVKFENTYSRNLVSADFDKAYWDGGRQTGTYTRSSAKSSTWTNTSPPSFPSAFKGTWKKVNVNNSLTFETRSLKFKANNKNPSWILSSISGDYYTFVAESNLSFSFKVILKIVSGSLEISNDNSGNNWNGKWEKQ